MNGLDIAIILCFIPAIIRGLSKGFIEQAVALASLVAGVWAALRFSGDMAAWLHQHIALQEGTLRLISFAVLLTGVILLLQQAGRLLTKAVHIVMLGFLDRLLGVLFSLCTAAVVIGLVVMLVEALNSRFHLIGSDLLESSVLYNIIRDAAYGLFPLLKGIITKS